MDRVDAVVAGAGVVGLAIGRELAAHGFETLVLEAEVTYVRHDGRTVTVPACTIFWLSDERSEEGAPLAKECRIYVDLTPLYAA